MLNVKFKKIKTAAFISHTDMQRAINRIIKRAGYEPDYSQGYNPHALLKLSSPIPLGIESAAEYLSIEIKEADENFLSNLNAASPQGLEFIRMWKTDKNPNFAGKIAVSDYIIRTEKAYPIREEIFINAKESFIIDAKEPGGAVKKKECKDLIYGLSIDKDKITARLASGNTTLRIDRFFEALNRDYNLGISAGDVLKAAAYYVSGSLFIDADSYLDNMVKGEEYNEIHK